MAGFNTISLKLKEMYQVLTELVFFLENFLLLSLELNVIYTLRSVICSRLMKYILQRSQDILLVNLVIAAHLLVL